MKKFFVFVIIILGIVGIGIFSIALGTEDAEEAFPQSLVSTGKVITESLKIRSGLSTENNYIGLLSKDDIVTIYGKADNWYIIKTANDLVGAVFADYIEEMPATLETSANLEAAENPSPTSLSQDEQVFLNLVNNQRIEHNLPEFHLDEDLLNLARLKAADIVQNHYFSHTSPTYGTLFDMLQSNSISYSKASENIAKNLNANGAMDSFMNSKLHRENILSSDFNYTGIAVQNSAEYGKVFVEIFVAK